MRRCSATSRESSRAAEAACTSRNSLPSKCSKCEKQTATAGCEVYTSCTETKQAPSSLHCSQARLSALSRKEGGRSRGAIAGGDRPREQFLESSIERALYHILKSTHRARAQPLASLGAARVALCVTCILPAILIAAHLYFTRNFGRCTPVFYTQF